MWEDNRRKKSLIHLLDRDFYCWEHLPNLALPIKAWVRIDEDLRKRNKKGILFIDDAHEHLLGINNIIETISKHDKPALKIVLVSSKANWNPRLKTPAIFAMGRQYEVSTLSDHEIESLLNVLESSSEIAAIVEPKFLGFSRLERRRRLIERCRKDMFVCMRNIFAFDAFDEIILREYATLTVDYQELYKKVAGLEAAGVRVHRQLA